MLPKCWLLRKFLWPIAHTVRKTRYFMKLKLLNLFWDYVLIISQECAKIPCWEGLFRKSAFAWHNKKLTTLERFLPTLFISRLYLPVKWKSLWPDLCKSLSWWKMQRGREGGEGPGAPVWDERTHSYWKWSPLWREPVLIQSTLGRDLSKSCCKQLRFFLGGRGEGLTFTSFGRRMYDSWETKDLIASVFEFSK